MTIDIFIPFYGDPEQFRQAVGSVLQQSEPDWRLVVINDCYPKWDPHEWLLSLDEPRIVSIKNSENVGVNASFNRCIELARSNYVCILGCDDRLLPNYVETVSMLISEFNDPDYVQPGVRVINEEGLPALPLADRIKSWIKPRIRAAQVLEGEAVVTTLMRGNWTYFPAITWRLDRLKQLGFGSQYEIVLDLELQVKILTSGGRFALSDKTCFEYRRHTKSASSYTAATGTRFEEEKNFYLDVANRFRQMGWSRAASAAKWHWTSRLNAVSHLPAATSRGDRKALGTLFRHIFR